MGQHYLYRHLIPDGNPFYIGIGTKRKMFSTLKSEYRRAYDFYDRGAFWKKMFKKYGAEVEILYEADSYQEIIKKEKEFISLYGRRNLHSGVLVNFTNGGEGSPGVIGRKWTEEQKQHLSKIKKGKLFSEEHKKQLSLSKKGKKLPLQTIEKARLSNIGRKHSFQTIEKNKASNRGKIVLDSTRQKLKYKKTEAHKEKLRQANLGKVLSENHKENIRKAYQKLPDEIKKKIAHADNRKSGWKMSEEAKLKMSIAKRGKKLSPEHIEKIKLNFKGHRHTPEAIEKMKLIKKEWWAKKKSNGL